MSKTSKTPSRKFWGQVLMALLKTFPKKFFCQHGGSAPVSLSPKNPNTPELYVPQKPYSRKHPPPCVVAAEDRCHWNERRVADWRERGGGDLWERIAEEVRNGTYGKRAHTYRGRTESVMGAAARELLFLAQWLERYRPRSPRRPAYRHKKPPASRHHGKASWHRNASGSGQPSARPADIQAARRPLPSRRRFKGP